MRISDWSSDVCSSDLINHRLTFKSEAVLRKTLYNGFAATQETYKKASRIKREILDVTDKLAGIWTLRVESLKFHEIPEDALPNPSVKPSDRKSTRLNSSQ